MNEEIEQREYRSDARVDASLAYLADQIIAAPDQKLLDLISNGWEDFYAELFGKRFIDSLDALETADRHHSEAIEWHWESRLALLKGGRPPDGYFAYFPTWARGNMKCIAAGTPVWMADGQTKPIEEVEIGDSVLTMSDDGLIVSRPVLDRWQPGLKDCVTLRTRLGREITATPDHWVKTFNGWRQIRDIAPDDRIASPRKIPTPSEDSSIPDEAVRLLTYFLMEGGTTRNGGNGFQCRLTSGDAAIVEDMYRCCSYFGYKFHKVPGENYDFSVSGGIREILRKAGMAGKKSTEKRLPEIFFTFSDRQVRQVLATVIDTDGWISPCDWGVALANGPLIDDLRRLFLKIGLVGKVYQRENGFAGCWTLQFDKYNLARFLDVPFRLKGERLARLASKRRYSLLDTYPQAVTSGLPPGVNRRLRRDIKWKPSYANPRITRDKLQRAMAALALPLWQWLENADVLWDEVVSIEASGVRTTYDIEVEETHNFIADGLVVHNTTTGRAMLRTDALMSFAHGRGGYALIPGGTKSKVRGTAMSVEKSLHDPKILKWCPALGQVERNVYGHSRGWTSDFIATRAGYVFHFIGLDEGVAGANVDDLRPTFIMPDDIDSREDSPVIAESRFKVFTTEVLPTRQGDTLIYWPQNLISRFSVRYRIEKQHAKVMTYRKPTVPVPAVRGLVTEQRTIGGIIKDVVVAGHPTWRVWTLQRVQDEIDTYGLPAFLAECHPAGTRVRSGYCDNVPIESIRKGDPVLTHAGRLRTVTDIKRRTYSGPLVSLKVANSSIPIQATENHPFYIVRPMTAWRWTRKLKNLEDPQWVKTSDLRVGDYVLEPVPKRSDHYAIEEGAPIWQFKPKDCGRPATGERLIHLSRELCRLTGYFLAEGSVGTSYVSLTFHEKETEYIEDVANLFFDVFGAQTSIKPDNGRSFSVQCSSKIARDFFAWVGTGSHFKAVPRWVFAAPDECIQELLIGYFRGDGCQDPSGFSYMSVSADLAEHIRQLLLRLGIVGGVYRLPDKRISLPHGGSHFRVGAWQGDIGGGHAVRLGEILGMPYASKGRNSAFIANGYVHRPIRKVTSDIVENLPVYNFEVEEDESYIAENVASHNCQHDVERVDEDRMIHTWQDAVHVISESEFESVYGKQKRLANGRMAMPPAWVKDWGNDWARTKTKFHANVSLWRTVSPQSSKLPGFTFYFHPKSYAPNSQPEDVAETLLSQLSDGPEYVKVETEFQTVYRPVSDKLAAKSWADLRIDELTRADALQHTRTTLDRIEFERTALAEVFPMYTEGTLKANNVLGGVNSHERDDIRKIYGAVYGLGCRGVNPKKFGGVEQINRDFKVDWNTAHPFRPGENGYSRTLVVVPDDLSQPPRTVDGMHVYPPKPFNDSLSPEALIDDDLFRFQMVSWRTRPATLTATGETIDDPEKLNDDFGNCFIAGTMVDTEFGERPIETIREGELVWTRQGLRPVLKAGMTAYDVEVVEARLSTGRTLCGTGDHPVWVEGSGWNRLQMLPTGSILGYRCQTINANPDLKDSFGGESPFTAIQTLVKGLTESILHLISPTEVKGSAIFTSRSGRTLTDQFRKAARSIIEITTHRITISTILSASPLAATGHITPAYEIRPRKTSSNWLGCGQTTTANTTGTVVPRGGGPCLSGQSSSPQINRESTLSAALAAKHSSQLSRRLNSAPPSALRGIETELSRLDRILASIRERARTVARNSWLGPQPKNAASPPVLLGTRQLAERQNVYNLEVSDVPEFFANGVLVHNCTQMMTVAGALGQAKLTIEQEYQMLVPAAAKPNPDIPMTHARQHAMEAARYAAQLQLEEKYGEELYEMVEEEDPF